MAKLNENELAVKMKKRELNTVVERKLEINYGGHGRSNALYLALVPPTPSGALGS